MENRPRKLWVAGLLSFFTIGLGHLYSGKAQKGIILYFGQGLLLITLLPFIVIYANIFVLIFSLIAGLGYFLYSIINAIKEAKINSTSYTLKKYNKWYFYLACFILANIIIQPMVEILIKENTVKAYKIPSGAMIPTLLPGDRILVDKFIYKRNEPQRGDIIIFPYPVDPTKDFVKRLIGLEGDIVEVRNKQLYINHELYNESYIINKDHSIIPVSQHPRDFFGPITIPQNSLFVMGDNRDNSHDSRFWGFVDKSTVKGKVKSLYWSWDKEAFKMRWERIGKTIAQVAN